MEAELGMMPHTRGLEEQPVNEAGREVALYNSPRDGSGEDEHDVGVSDEGWDYRKGCWACAAVMEEECDGEVEQREEEEEEKHYFDFWS